MQALWKEWFWIVVLGVIIHYFHCSINMGNRTYGIEIDMDISGISKSFARRKG